MDTDHNKMSLRFSYMMRVRTMSIPRDRFMEIRSPVKAARVRLVSRGPLMSILTMNKT